MFFRNAVKILRHISYCFSTQFHFFCNDSWCHLIVSNQDSTIAFCFAENEHRICGNRTMMMMMMMSDVVLVNTLVLIIYFEHASAACTCPPFLQQDMTDILTDFFWPRCFAHSFYFYLLLSPRLLKTNWEEGGGFYQEEKSIPLQDIQDNLISQSDSQENWFLVNKLISRWRGYIPPPLKRRKIQMLGFTFPLNNIFCKIHYEQSASSVKYKQTQRWLSHLQAGLEKLLSELVSSSGLQRVWKVGFFLLISRFCSSK